MRDDPALGPAIVREATRLGIDPAALATAIAYETVGTFNPGIIGGAGNRYMGLIQFGPNEQAKYGIVPGMTADQQMVKVGDFLSDRGLKPGSGLLDIYSTINAGSPGHYGFRDASGKTVAQHVAQMKRTYGPIAAGIVGSRDQVTELQTYLKSQGFDPGPIDGEIGPQTQAALAAYQAANPAAGGETEAMAFAPSIATSSPADAAIKTAAPAVNIAPPSIATQPPVVKTGVAPVDRVVNASIASDPAGITAGWNDLVSGVIGGTVTKQAAMDAFKTVPENARIASASSYAFNPDLWKSVPALVPTAPMKSAADDLLTGGHALDQMNQFGIGPSSVSDTSAPVSRETQGEIPQSVTWPSMAAANKPSIATTAPSLQADYSPGSPDFPQALPSAQMGGIDVPPTLGPPTDVPDVGTPPIPPADVGPPPVAAPPPKTIASQGPGVGIPTSRMGSRIYNAIAKPISSGSSNFWSGPMIQPFFTQGGGGATMPYQPNTGRTTTDVRGNSVNVGVYTDEHGNQHEYTWSPSGAP